MKTEIKRKKGILVIFAIFLCYFLLLAPYVVHTNLNEVDACVVKDLKTVSVQSLPEDVQDVAAFNAECTILLVEESVSRLKGAIITKKALHSLNKGDVIKVTDKITEWYVDWHAYQFFDKKFDVLIVGDVEQISAIESSIEKILSSRLGGPIFSLSKVIFLSAPLLLVVYISFYSRKRLYFWNIPAILALYSLEVFASNVLGSVHHITIPEVWKYFGYLFLLLIPFTFLFSRYEESEEGQRGIKKFYDKVSELLARLFQ